MDSEILNISEHSFWIYFNGKEYQVPFDRFPWFKDCSVKSIFNYEFDQFGNFHWPDIDVDLNTEILENPEKYPLISKR